MIGWSNLLLLVTKLLDDILRVFPSKSNKPGSSSQQESYSVRKIHMGITYLVWLPLAKRSPSGLRNLIEVYARVLPTVMYS